MTFECDKGNMSEVFLHVVEGNQQFLESLTLVQKNSEGQIWVIGGFVYKNIASVLYGDPKPTGDIDFLVEKLKDSLDIPAEYVCGKTSLGSLRLKKSNFQVDIVKLANVYTIKKINAPECVGSYLDSTPLTVQSIVYDMTRQQIIGDVGIAAIIDKTVKIHNLDNLSEYCEQKGISIESYVRKHAESLGFKAIYN